MNINMATPTEAYINEYVRKSNIPESVREDIGLSLKEAQMIEADSDGKESILLAYDFGMARGWMPARMRRPTIRRRARS